MSKTTRRAFLADVGQYACLAGLSGLFSPLLSCVHFRYARFSLLEAGKKVVVDLAEFGEEIFVVLAIPSLPHLVYLRKLPDNTYAALLMRCTHKQCEVNPAGNKLVCPCHGSEFAADGSVLHGPAKTALLRFPASVEANHITITLVA